jgi:hypothetical protein
MLKNTYTKGSKYDDNYLKPFNEDYSVLGKVKGIYNGIISFNKVWEPLEKTFYAKPYFNARIEEIDELDKYIEIGPYMVFYRVGDYNSQGFDGFELHEENSNKCSWICLINKLKENDIPYYISLSFVMDCVGSYSSYTRDCGLIFREKNTNRYGMGYFIPLVKHNRTSDYYEPPNSNGEKYNPVTCFQDINIMKQNKTYTNFEMFANIDNTGTVFTNKLENIKNIKIINYDKDYSYKMYDQDDRYYDLNSNIEEGLCYEFPSCFNQGNNNDLLIPGIDPYRVKFNHNVGAYRITENNTSEYSFDFFDCTLINSKKLKINKRPEVDFPEKWIIIKSNITFKIDDVFYPIYDIEFYDNYYYVILIFENDIPVVFNKITFIIPPRLSRITPKYIYDNQLYKVRPFYEGPYYINIRYNSYYGNNTPYKNAIYPHNSIKIYDGTHPYPNKLILDFNYNKQATNIAIIANFCDRDGGGLVPGSETCYAYYYTKIFNYIKTSDEPLKYGLEVSLNYSNWFVWDYPTYPHTGVKQWITIPAGRADFPIQPDGNIFSKWSYASIDTDLRKGFTLVDTWLSERYGVWRYNYDQINEPLPTEIKELYTDDGAFFIYYKESGYYKFKQQDIYFTIY